MTLVCKDQSVCLVKINNYVYLIGSHSHKRYGASIVRCDYMICPKLLKTWDIIKNNDMVYSCILTIND